MRIFVASVLAVLLVSSCPFSMSEVVKTFDGCSEFFLRGQPPVIPDILIPDSDHVRYKKICQKYGSKNAVSIYRFATLYDTESRIPVFSAYKFTRRGDFDRPDIPWKIEPQLDPHVADMTVPYKNQAINEDYFENEFGMNRGHLFPSSYAVDVFSAESTFTLTNIVPQYADFNAGGWRNMEIASQESMNTHCFDNNAKVLAHVLTGAIPGKNILNNKVNIPSSMWMAFCCFNSRNKLWVSKAYWALNKRERDDGAIPEKSLQELQQFLSQNWVKKNSVVQLFKDNCRNVSESIH